MTALVIDIGNSRIKAAIFKDSSLIWVDSFLSIAIADMAKVIQNYRPAKALICSVKSLTEKWENDLATLLPVKRFNAAMVNTIINHYKTPQTLGVDRLAAVTGAYNIYPANANLVINAGTCITYDVVDADRNYLGGCISPGLKMRFEALNNYTDGLPLIEPNVEFDSVIGDSTTSAITSGVQNGIRFEILGFITEFIKNQTNTNVILSGGDAIFFDTLLKNSIFAAQIKTEPYLVLKGLNAVIQQHND